MNKHMPIHLTTQMTQTFLERHKLPKFIQEEIKRPKQLYKSNELNS